MHKIFFIIETLYPSLDLSVFDKEVQMLVYPNNGFASKEQVYDFLLNSNDRMLDFVKFVALRQVMQIPKEEKVSFN